MTVQLNRKELKRIYDWYDQVSTFESVGTMDLDDKIIKKLKRLIK